MTRKLYWLAALPLLALPLIHPFGAVRRQHDPAFLPDENAGVLKLFEKACRNCHSQRTEWPVYSYLPVVSWLVEKDVANARRRMDLSHWTQYSLEEKRDLLARIGVEVRHRRMPPPRYLLLHPRDRLSGADIQAIYEWTLAQRRDARNRRE